jgi:hypothetical protein
MPTPVISQPISTAPAPAPEAMFCGSEKTPLPIIEPMTRAVSKPSFNCFGAVVAVGV